MPNYCNFQIKANGTADSLKKFISYLEADYNYGDDALISCDAEQHFCRVFETNVDDSYDLEEDGTVYIDGYCAWSVYSCMFEGSHTYFNDLIKYKDTKVTSMPRVSKELNLDIEIFSEEPGCGFMEHYIVKNGEIIVNDCVDYSENLNEETGEYEPVGGIPWDFQI